MVSPQDPIEAFLQSVKNALSPLSTSFQHMAKLKNKPESCHVAALSVATSAPSPSPSFKTPFKSIACLFQNSCKKEAKEKENKRKDESECMNCLQFVATCSVLVNDLVQSFPRPFKSVKKCFGTQIEQERMQIGGKSSKEASFGAKKRSNSNSKLNSGSDSTPGFDLLSLELLLCLAIDDLVQNFQNFNVCNKEKTPQKPEESPISKSNSPPPQFDHLGFIKSLINGKKADFDGFMSNLHFAKVTLVGPTDSSDDSADRLAEPVTAVEREDGENGKLPQKLANSLLNIPLSNVERLRSTLSAVSLAELVEFIPSLGKSGSEHPNKKKLISVQDFFRYTEAEGRRFFEELDRDGDGQVTLEDLEIAMRKRKLPKRYAKDLLRRTRRNLFAKSIGWKQFLSLMEQKEPTILRAYTTLCLSKSGTLQKNQILNSLKGAGLPANEDNAVAMIKYLNRDSEGAISYGHFRNFMLLLPSERLEDDPRSIWFEAATVVAVPPPVEIPAGSVLKSALAGGLASALSTSVMHPIDTMKTRVQASTLSFPELIAKLPQIGIQGLYRGSIPAILGQFSSHGLRTGIFEASKLVLFRVAPSLPEIQVQSMASFCSTILGTAVRIPCEVLKQRLQAGIFDNVGEAIVGTFKKDGPRGFFRGTGATLCREVPFYVAGMCLYAEAKKGAQYILNRELEPWETITVGALSGGLAAVVTTPFDVMKTRMMTAPQGLPVSMQIIAFSILRKEGPLGLFKGALPRFFWIAPLGAMNFAGYELAKKAMEDKNKGELVANG